MAEKKQKEAKFLTYKGRPLVRSGNTIYYGSMADKYVVMLQIQETKKSEGGKALDLSQKVLVQLMYTDPDLRVRDRVIKKSEKTGLYNAMDLGAVWLERALAE